MQKARNKEWCFLLDFCGGGSVPIILRISRRYPAQPEASEGGMPDRPPPQKMPVEYWCYIGYILSDKNQKVIKMWKRQISIEIFIKRYHNFHDFLSKQAGFIVFRSWWKLFMKCWLNWVHLKSKCNFSPFSNSSL